MTVLCSRSLPFGLYGAGYGQVKGVVTELGVVGRHYVRLYERDSGACVAETISNEAGEYVFMGVARNRTFYVLALDHGPDPVNAAISDYVTAEPMDE